MLFEDGLHALNAAQIAFGSGFKCNSAVFRAMRTIHDPDHLAWQMIASGQREAII